MSILTGYVSDVEFVVPDGTNSATFTVTKNGVEIQPGTPATVEGMIAKATLPYAAVTDETDISVTLTFNYQAQQFTQTKTVEVRTPILPLHEVGRIIESDDIEEQIRVESAVRYIIQAHTGQSFGKFVGKKRISGNGDGYLRMPQRLISISTINGGPYLIQSLALRGGGWFLVYRNMGVPTIRADFDGWHEDPYVQSSVPIIPPHISPHYTFLQHREYEIDGVWGWDGVPAAVQEAAKLLVNDYACGDSNYRDRFLTSMTAADWRIQFHDGAFSNTGNVRANQLLAEYVLRRGWTVI